MIRDEALIEKLIADLHFHNYLKVGGTDLMGQSHNLVASNSKRQVIWQYIDDVSLDLFFRTNQFKPIVVAQKYCNKRYSAGGLIKVTDDIVTLNLNNIYDRCTFVRLIFHYFFGNKNFTLITKEPNTFLNTISVKECRFTTFSGCGSIKQDSCAEGHEFEEYLDSLYGFKHSKYKPINFSSEIIKFNGWYKKKHRKSFHTYDGLTVYDIRKLSDLYNSYIEIKDKCLFGEYTVEELFFIYSVLIDKLRLSDDNFLTFLAMFLQYEQSAYPESIINQICEFELALKAENIEPYINSKDLYLRLTSAKRSKAFTFEYEAGDLLSIRLFDQAAVKMVYKNNPLPLPYLYNELLNN